METETVSPMNQGQVVDMFQQTLWMMTLLCGPILLVSLVLGVAISIFQTATSIQEQTLSFVPKLLVTFLVLLVMGPWMISTLVQHTGRVLDTLIKLG
jgi:flagellar biosynthesis protein FliQ